MPTGNGWSARRVEIGLLPDPLLQILLDHADVQLSCRRIPAARIPPSHAAPKITGVILPSPGPVVEPDLVPVIARPPDGVGGVRVHRCRRGNPGPACLLEWIPGLQDAVTLRALARSPISPEPVTGRAARSVRSPVTEGVLPPPALDGGLGEDDVLADTPLAGCPPENLLGSAGEVAADQRDQRGYLRAIACREEATSDTLSDGVVEDRVQPACSPGSAPLSPNARTALRTGVSPRAEGYRTGSLRPARATLMARAKRTAAESTGSRLPPP